MSSPLQADHAQIDDVLQATLAEALGILRSVERVWHALRQAVREPAP